MGEIKTRLEDRLEHSCMTRLASDNVRVEPRVIQLQGDAERHLNDRVAFAESEMRRPEMNQSTKTQKAKSVARGKPFTLRRGLASLTKRFDKSRRSKSVMYDSSHCRILGAAKDLYSSRITERSQPETLRMTATTQPVRCYDVGLSAYDPTAVKEVTIYLAMVAMN